MQRHVTSVFSQYQTMDNNSANSKQLQYWLKQISNPISSPNLGFQWTFMSNQSSQHQRHRNIQQINQHSDQVSFGKTVHSSIDRDNKENISLVSNANSNNSNATLQNKSKSYVNAMLALQKKVKTLQDQNSLMRKNVHKINEERNKYMSQSSIAEEQLKSRLKILQPKLIKIDELIEQNKSLRETRDEKTRKIKLLQKNYQEIKTKYQESTYCNEIFKKQNIEYGEDLQKKNNKIRQLQAQVKRVYDKNKMLQDIKQKSTLTLLEKYNKSIEHMQMLEKQNGKLKNQIAYLKNKSIQDIKNMQQNHNNQIKRCHIEFEKLKQNLNLRQSLIQEKKRQAEYFRQAYQKKDQEYIQLVKSQHQLIQNQQKQRKQRYKQKQMQEEKKLKLSYKKQTKLQEKDKMIFKVNINKQSKDSSFIQMPQTLIPGPSPRNKKSFDGFQSQEQQQQFDESVIPVPTETKSVGKPVKKLRTQRKANLSSQSRKAESKKSKNQQIKIQPNLSSPKQHKKIMKKKRSNYNQQASFTMKSCQPPKSQPMHKITFEGQFGSQERQNKQNKIANSYFYTSQYPPLPNSTYRIANGPQEEIQQFYCRHNTSQNSIGQAMLIQLQKQLLQLYEQQQNLILASNQEHATQAERSQFVGRLKQINQHLRIKNHKICELKSRI